MKNYYWIGESCEMKEKIKQIPVIGTITFKIYMMCQAFLRHKNNIRRVKRLQKSSSPCVFYLDVPVHPNLGDNAQYICTVNWIKENYPKHSLVTIDGWLISDLKSGIIKKLKELISPNDIIYFQSGYCTQDLGGYHNLVHQVIVSNFPNTPIVMLPQTVYFQNEDNAKKTAEIYSHHKKLFFMARDFTSAEIAKSIFPFLTIHTYPDIVTTMIGVRKTTGRNREGIVLCVRDDCEKFYTDREIRDLATRFRKKYQVTICDTTVEITGKDFGKEVAERIEQMLCLLQQAKVVVTDRYHGTIFSLVAGTPVVVVKTTDHKVKTGVEWFNGVYDDYVCYADTLEEAYDKAEMLISKRFDYNLKPYFKEKYYDILKNEIDNWLVQ